MQARIVPLYDTGAPLPVVGGEVRNRARLVACEIVPERAESRSDLVLARLARPEAPVIYGTFGIVMDIKTTVFSCGASEMSLKVAATAQMAQHNHLPFFGTVGCSEAKFPDAQAAAAAAFSCLSSDRAGANLVHDSGWLDHGSTASPAYMVLVNEVLDMVNQFTAGILVNDQTLALDLIDAVGPGGHFLHESHTLDHFRLHWCSEPLDRYIRARSLNRGGKHFERRLQELTAEVMKHEPVPLPAELLAELERMAQAWQ